jgi:hypothetical protein
VLRDHLLAEQDWNAAARRYAEEHRRYYASLHRIHSWFRDLWFGAGAKPMHCVPERFHELLKIRPVFRIFSPAAPKRRVMTARGGACLAKVRIIEHGLSI